MEECEEVVKMVSEMGIEKVRRLLVKMYFTDRETTKLLLGAPGIGKSVAVKEVAKEVAEKLGKEFIEYNDFIAGEILKEPEKYFVFVDIRLTEVEPSDLIGIPREMNGYVTYRPLLWAYTLSKCDGVLFLDELTNVQRLDVKAAMFKLLLDRKVGFIKLSDGVMIVAAGNTPEHSSIAEKLPAPSTNRVDVILVKSATLDEWKEWMDMNYEKWDKRVYAFLKRYSKFFIEVPEEPETLEQFATPRRWTSLAVVLARGEFDEDELEVVVNSKVGREAGMHFLAFIKNPIIEPEKLLAKPELWNDLKEESKYLTMVALVEKFEEDVKKKKIEQYRQFMKHILMNDREFMGVMIALMNMNTAMALALDSVKNFRELYEFILKIRKRLSANVEGGGKR